MADPPAHEQTSDDTAGAGDHGSPPRTPRWVKVSGVLALVAVVALVVMILTGGGPSRHLPGGGSTQQPQQPGGHR